MIVEEFVVEEKHKKLLVHYMKHNYSIEQLRVVSPQAAGARFDITNNQFKSMNIKRTPVLSLSLSKEKEMNTGTNFVQ